MPSIPLSWVGIPLLIVFLHNPVQFSQGLGAGMEYDKTDHRVTY